MDTSKWTTTMPYEDARDAESAAAEIIGLEVCIQRIENDRGQLREALAKVTAERNKLQVELAECRDGTPPPPPDPPPTTGPVPLLFPHGDILYRPIENARLHPQHAEIMAVTNGSKLHPDFGSGRWQGKIIGIPTIVVPYDQVAARVYVNAAGGWESAHFDLVLDSDAIGPYALAPIPLNAPIEEGSTDAHVVVVRLGEDGRPAHLYELWQAQPNGNGSWSARNLSYWDLGNSSNQRGVGITSSTAGGLPLHDMLVHYDRLQAAADEDRSLGHPLRITLPKCSQRFMLPCTHWASDTPDGLPPFGAWYRLKRDVYDAELSSVPKGFYGALLHTMRKHGLIVDDNGGGGTGVQVTGVPDERWNNEHLKEIFNTFNLPEHFEVIVPPGTDGRIYAGFAGYRECADATGLRCAGDCE